MFNNRYIKNKLEDWIIGSVDIHKDNKKAILNLISLNHCHELKATIEVKKGELYFDFPSEHPE